MATVTDHLITKMSLDTGQFKSAARDIAETTRGTLSVVGALGKTALFGGGALGGGLIGMAAYAVKAAMGFDVMQRSLITVTGSMERAAKVMKFAEDLAGPSAFFGTEDLGKAASMLETFRLQTERFLPLASTMASLFGQNTESLMSFVYALGRIKSGTFGEGFERMREFGISRQDLAAQGLQFNKGGEFQGSVEQALTAIESVIKQKFGNLDAVMRDSPMAKWTSLLDAVQRLAKDAGTAMLKYIAPVIEKVGAGISNIVANKDLGAMIDRLFKGFDANAFGNKILYGIASVIAALKQMPNIIKGVFGFFNNIIGGTTGAMKLLSAVLIASIGTNVVKGIIAVGKAYQFLRTTIVAAAAAEGVLQALQTKGAALAWIGAAVGGGLALAWALNDKLSKSEKGEGSIGGFDMKQFSQDRGILYSQMKGLNPKWAKFFGKGSSGQDGSNAPSAQEPPVANGYLREIAKNTKSMNYNFQRMISGGSELGRSGATAVELHGLSKERRIAHAVRIIVDEMSAQSGLVQRAVNRAKSPMTA